MPATASRRRVRRAEPESDAIMEDEDMRNAQEDEDNVEDDDEPAERSRNIKRIKKERKSKRRNRADEDDEEQEQEDRERSQGPDEVAIDIRALRNEPLDAASEQKLKSLASDWSALSDCIKLATEKTRDVAVAIEETATTEEERQYVQNVEDMYKELLDAQVILGVHRSTLDNIRQRVARREKITHPIEIYEKGVKMEVNGYRKKSERQKYAKNEDYKQFRQEVWEVNNPDQAMPPVTSFLKKDDQEESDSDDDLEMGGVTQDFKCPLTLTPFVNPMTSRTCKHSFSAQPLKEYLKKASRPCPATGCNQQVTIADFYVDTELAKRAQAAAKRQKRREEAEEEEEDDIID